MKPLPTNLKRKKKKMKAHLWTFVNGKLIKFIKKKRVWMSWIKWRQNLKENVSSAIQNFNYIL